MLKLYIIDTGDSVDNNKEVIVDVEAYFSKIDGISNSMEVRHFIKSIDHGEFVSDREFKDRSGRLLPVSDLSTGCKTAIIVSMYPDTIVDIAESGYNARDEIIKTCKNGNIVLDSLDMTVSGNGKTKIDVENNGYEIKTIERLNRYISDEKPFKPIMDSDIMEVTVWHIKMFYWTTT